MMAFQLACMSLVAIFSLFAIWCSMVAAWFYKETVESTPRYVRAWYAFEALRLRCIDCAAGRRPWRLL
jgi:hypothetical protein